MKKYTNNNFYNIINEVIKLEEFKKLKNINHHGISRYNHSIRVAYYTYIITKKLHLNYIEATKGAILHDFFTDDVEEYREIFKLRRHPNCALENASLIFKLTDIEKDIISKHMFPITFRPPKYLESWIVDIVDDISAIYEKSYVIKKELKASITFIFLIVINFIKMI